MIQKTLIEAKKLLDFYINEGMEDLGDDQIESVKHFIKALNVECACDAYYGFDCGCGERYNIKNETLKEINKKQKK